MISLQQEFLSSFKKDATKLLEDHYEEVESSTSNWDMNPNWELYEKLEEMGLLGIFTLRDDSLIGYVVTITNTSLHHKTVKMSSTDLLYIIPSHRGGNASKMLIEFAEDCLKQDGVERLFISFKNKSADAYMKRIGYNKVETIYCKDI